jgi:hypothetical protein
VSINPFTGFVEGGPAKEEGFWARFNHPIFGAFVTSWIAWNWEVPYLLIRGLATATDTIKEIHEKYLVSDRLSHLLWIPALVSAAFLLGGPVLKELYELYKSKMKARIGRYAVVSKWEYDQLEEQKRRETQEKDIFQRAIQSTPAQIQDGKGGYVTLEQLIRTNESLMNDFQRLNIENNKLKSDLLLLHKK